MHIEKEGNMRVRYRSSVSFLIILSVVLLYGSVQTQTPCCDKAGDANNDGKIGIGDAVYLMHIFNGGPAPTCMQEGDANADGFVNVADVVFLDNYIFKGGPAPVCGPETPPGPIPSSEQVHLYWDIIRTSSGAVVDTLITGQLYTLRLGIENSILLRGIGFGFRVFSSDVASMHWQMRPDNPSWVNYSIVPGCRMDPVSTVWDVAFLFSHFDMDSNLPDRFVLGGASTFGGLAAGPRQVMITIPFTPDSVSPDVRTLCIDSSAGSYGEGADFVFADAAGQGLRPVLEWPLGGRCWVVRIPVGFAGDPNGDGLTNVGDVVYLVNYIFKSGPAPDPLLNSDANCDGKINIGDCVYLINFVFKSGPRPCPL
jgi:Dockerin type I domain